MDHPSRVRLSACQTERGNLYGSATTQPYGSVTHANKFGTDIAVRSKAPPPLAEYDAYLRGRNVRPVRFIHRGSKTGAKLRRIVIMRREGSSWKECAEATGTTPGTAREWVEMLPQELAV